MKNERPTPTLKEQTRAVILYGGLIDVFKNSVDVLAGTSGVSYIEARKAILDYLNGVYQ